MSFCVSLIFGRLSERWSSDLVCNGVLIGKDPRLSFFYSCALKWRLRVTKHRLRGARNAGPQDGIVLLREAHTQKDEQ